MQSEHIDEHLHPNAAGTAPAMSPTTALAPPIAPDGMTREDIEATTRQAESLVNHAVESAGSGEMAAIDGIVNIGVSSQRDATNQLGQFKTRVADSLIDGGAGKEISSGLRDLRRTLNQINPNVKPALMDRVMSRIPLVSSSRGPVKVLQRIAVRYQPASAQIVELEDSLRQGRATLVKDNVELRKLYQQIETQQSRLKQAIYFGELLAFNLDQQIGHIEDIAKRGRFEDARYNVVMRVVNLRAMETVHNQYFLSIEMSRQNNVRLGQAVEHTLTLATNVITIGIAIQQAMQRQRAVGDAAAKTRAFLGDVITGNAATIKQHTVEIGDLYTSPVIATEKISQAHGDLVEALDSAEQLRQEGLARVRENIEELSRMSREIEQRLDGVGDGPSAMRLSPPTRK